MTSTHLDVIAAAMIHAGLTESFVAQILALAGQSEGVDDLMHLWVDAPDNQERKAVETALQDALDDRLPPEIRKLADHLS